MGSNHDETSILYPVLLSGDEVRNRIGPEKKVKVANIQGLHTRPASAIVQTLALYSAEVAITYRKKTVNARSVLGLLMLGAPCGSSLTIKASGQDAQEAIGAVVELFEKLFHEEAV